MLYNLTLVEISAFSGLAGAILTQALSGVFTYFGDKRKDVAVLKSTYRTKQLEIAENFYFVTGETMSVLKKSIEHWKDHYKPRSESSIRFFNKEMKTLDASMEKLNADNWKHNLVGLYFKVSLCYTELIEANTKSHLLYLGLLDIADKYKSATTGDKELLLGKYYTGMFDLCSQYELIYNMLEKDMINVNQNY
jgi:hypothetical protein